MSEFFITPVCHEYFCHGLVKPRKYGGHFPGFVNLQLFIFMEAFTSIFQVAYHLVLKTASAHWVLSSSQRRIWLYGPLVPGVCSLSTQPLWRVSVFFWNLQNSYVCNSSSLSHEIVFCLYNASLMTVLYNYSYFAFFFILKHSYHSLPYPEKQQRK